MLNAAHVSPDTGRPGAFQRLPKAGGRSARALPPTVMVAVENPVVAKVMADSLAHAGFTTLTASTDPDVAALLDEVLADILVLDARLAGTSAWAAAGQDGAGGRPKAVVMLVERGMPASGARQDGCIVATLVKPVSAEALVDAVVRASVEKKSEPDSSRSERLGPLLIDCSRQQVLVDHGEAPVQAVELSPSEFRLLHFFASHSDRVVTRAEILRGVWGATAVLEERTVDVHIVRLRNALKPFGLESIIRTVRGAGYAVGTLPGAASSDCG